MNKLINILLNVVLLFTAEGMVCSCSDASEKETAPVVSTKRERNSIKEGNELYEQMRYAEAVVLYMMAVE